MAEYREQVKHLREWTVLDIQNRPAHTLRMMQAAADTIEKFDAVPVTPDYREGDVCIYGFAEENKSCAIVEIVKVLDDDRGVAKVKFLKVICDDTGNGLFNYLQKCGDTMNASFKYMKNITPRIEGA